MPADDSLITDATLTQIVNAALQRISTERDWPWLETSTTFATANGVATYPAPAGWQRSISVLSAAGFPLRRTPIDELDWQGGAGTPRNWGLFGDQVVLRPIPTGVETLTHRYLGTEPALTADGQSPTMPVGYHYAIVEYAAYLVFRRTGNVTEAGAALAAYQEWRGQMESQLDRYSDSQGGALSAEQPAKAAK